MAVDVSAPRVWTRVGVNDGGLVIGRAANGHRYAPGGWHVRPGMWLRMIWGLGGHVSKLGLGGSWEEVVAGQG